MLMLPFSLKANLSWSLAKPMDYGVWLGIIPIFKTGQTKKKKVKGLRPETKNRKAKTAKSGKLHFFFKYDVIKDLMVLAKIYFLRVYKLRNHLGLKVEYFISLKGGIHNPALKGFLSGVYFANPHNEGNHFFWDPDWENQGDEFNLMAQLKLSGMRLLLFFCCGFFLFPWLYLMKKLTLNVWKYVKK